MKKIIAVIVLGLLSLAGCERKVSVLSADGKQALIPEKKLTDHDKVQFLREEAKKRGLHWTVWCISWAAPNQPGFQAIAWREGQERHDKTHDRWMEQGRTQAEAAYALYFAIQGDPTHPGESPREVKKEKEYKRICPPDLSDKNNNEPCDKCKIDNIGLVLLLGGDGKWSGGRTRAGVGRGR